MSRRNTRPFLRNGLPITDSGNELDTAGQLTDWFRISDLQNVTIHVYGIVSGDVIQVEGTSYPTALGPGVTTPAAQIQQIGADVTASGFYRVEKGPDVIRLKLSADAGGGSVSARGAGDLMT